MVADAVMTKGWRGFLLYAASRLDMQEAYHRETGEMARYPDQSQPSANDNLSVSGSVSPHQAALRYAYWVTLTGWGRAPGPTAEFMAEARAAFPEQARRMDAGWDRRLEMVL